MINIKYNVYISIYIRCYAPLEKTVAVSKESNIQKTRLCQRGRHAHQRLGAWNVAFPAHDELQLSSQPHPAAKAPVPRFHYRLAAHSAVQILPH